MVQTKKMNEAFSAKLLKELTVSGELIRARQDEKQSLLDEFDSECKRFFFGKISRRALESSAKKTNNELHRLNAEIRKSITDSRRTAERVQELVSMQSPISYRATISGISGGKKKKVIKKKVVKKKITAKKKRTKKKR